MNTRAAEVIGGFVCRREKSKNMNLLDFQQTTASVSAAKYAANHIWHTATYTNKIIKKGHPL